MQSGQIQGRIYNASRARMVNCLAMVLVASSINALLPNSSWAVTPAEQRGRTFAENNCAKCHSIDRVTPSPLSIAPPLRTLHKKYAIETLAEAFAEGIYTGHPTMPTFQLDLDQIHDLLSYIKSLEN